MTFGEWFFATVIGISAAYIVYLSIDWTCKIVQWLLRR